jgi:hypothetical protein
MTFKKGDIPHNKDRTEIELYGEKKAEGTPSIYWWEDVRFVRICQIIQKSLN